MIGCVTAFLDLFIIVTLTTFLLNEARKGTLSAEWAGALLCALVALLATARALRMSLVRLLLTVAVPVTALVVFVIWHGEGDPRSTTEIFSSVATLLVVLFGLYVMLRGALGAFFGKRTPKDDR